MPKGVVRRRSPRSRGLRHAASRRFARTALTRSRTAPGAARRQTYRKVRSRLSLPLGEDAFQDGGVTLEHPLDRELGPDAGGIPLAQPTAALRIVREA